MTDFLLGDMYFLMENILIRPAEKADAEAIVKIYNYYIQNTVITFEESTLSAEKMAERIENVTGSGLPWLVAQEKDTVAGYAYAAKWKERSAYRHTVEISVYVSHSSLNKGWGTKLYEALFSELGKTTVHVAVGGIALPNPSSIALHEKFGMEKVAHFKAVGYKFDQWIDVGYWQKQFNE